MTPQFDDMIRDHRRAWTAIGKSPDDEESPEMVAWEARIDAAHAIWERLIDTPPRSVTQARKLALYVAGHECSDNIDRNDAPARALRAIAAGLKHIARKEAPHA